MTCLCHIGRASPLTLVAPRALSIDFKCNCCIEFKGRVMSGAFFSFQLNDKRWVYNSFFFGMKQKIAIAIKLHTRDIYFSSFCETLEIAGKSRSLCLSRVALNIAAGLGKEQKREDMQCISLCVCVSIKGGWLGLCCNPRAESEISWKRIEICLVMRPCFT